LVGSTDPITDSATVAGAASGGGIAPVPTGSVTFYLCGPTELTGGVCAGTDGTQVGSAVPVNAAGVAASADAQSLISGLGTYCFRAHFVAAVTDTNYPGATADESNAAAECFTVTAVASTSTVQRWLPNDQATITATGGAAVAGYVVFSLYDTNNCTGQVAATFGADPNARLTLDANGQALTNNTTFYTSNKVVSWRATFTSTNSVGSGTSSHCETSSIATYNNDTGS
jgi:hypothetical protein